MKIMAVDTDQPSLNHLLTILRILWPQEEILSFSNPMMAVKYGINESADLIFTEIRMRGVDGLTLARLIRQHQPQIKIIFVTESCSYGVDAMHLHADGYLCKPVTLESVRSSCI